MSDRQRLRSGALRLDRRAVLSRAVLSKAVFRASGLHRIIQARLASILGLSEASVSRLGDGTFCLQEDSKPFELAALLVPLRRGLDAITGNDDRAACAWLESEKDVLAGRPVDLIRQVAGLVAAVEYVDPRRATV